MRQKLSKMRFLVLMLSVASVVQAATIKENFDSQTLPSTDTPPGQWIFMDVENQAGTYYEAVTRGDGMAGRVKADVVVNTFFAAGYLVNPTGVKATTPFSGSFDILVENEGGWSDGLFMFGDILNGHTGEYYKLKYVGAGNSTAVFDSNYPDTSQNNVLNTGASINFDAWYTTVFTWTPTDNTTGLMAFEIQDSSGTELVTASVEITLPETVYFGFGSSNDAIQVDDIVIEYVSPTLASAPSPSDSNPDVPVKGLSLSWTPGVFAQTHDVYVGQSFDDVNDATRSLSANVVTSIGQDANTLALDRLEFGTPYFWRVDEVNGTPDQTIFRGEIWTFTAEPYSLPVSGSTIAVTASSVANELSVPEKVIDGSGLDEDGRLDIAPDTMWYSASGDLDPWIQFEFDEVLKLDIMRVWNSNSSAEAAIGWGVKDVDIATSTDGQVWNVLEDANQFSRATGLPAYDQYDEIAFNGAAAKYVRLNIASNWGGILMSYSLSEVQFDKIPVYARTPEPASDSVDVLPGDVVTWRAGRDVDEHVIYVSTDQNVVADGTAPSVTSPTNSLDLSDVDLELGQTYYWRVDEVNQAEAVTVWPGPVWNLTTPETLVVDDFEGYSNLSPNRPFQTWLDGFGYSADEFYPVAYAGNGTGSGVGHDIWSLSSPYYDGQIMEVAIARSGQSMPLYFNNSNGISLSEAVRTFDVPQDWTLYGLKSMTLNIYGQPESTGQLYVKINDAKIMADHVNVSVAQWQTLAIDLSTVNTDLTNVTTLTIGVEGNGAAGLLFVDDIRLMPTVSTGIDIGSEGTMLNNGGTLASQWIRSDSPEDVKGGAMFVGALPSGADLRGILAFSLEIFKPGDVISDVTVSLFHGANGTGNHTDGSITSSSLELVLVTNPAYANDRASWNNADQDTPVAWNTPGGDLGGTLDTVTGLDLTTLDTHDEVAFNSEALTAAVQAAVDAGDSRITFVLKSPDLEAETTRNFFAFQSTTAGSIGPNLHVDLD